MDERCENATWYDNGYLYGYYCDLTGNKCKGITASCVQYKTTDTDS